MNEFNENNKESLTTIKVTAELRNKIKKLAGEKTQGDFILSLIEGYQNKISEDEIGVDVNELNSLHHYLRRIESIYIEIAKSRHDVIDKAECEKEKMTRENDRVKAEMVDVTKKYEDTIQQLTTQMEELESNNAAEENKQLQDELTKAKITLAEKDTTIKNVTDKLAEATAHNTKIQEQFDQLQADKLEEVEALKKQLTAYEKQIAIQEFKLESLQKIISELSKNINEVKAEKEKFFTFITSQTQQAADLKQDEKKSKK